MCTHRELLSWQPYSRLRAAPGIDSCPSLSCLPSSLGLPCCYQLSYADVHPSCGRDPAHEPAGSNLLCTLNELLSRTAVMVQPLVHLEQLPAPALQAAAQETHLVRFVDVPLPLRTVQESRPTQTTAAHQEIAGPNPANRSSSGSSSRLHVQQGEAGSGGAAAAGPLLPPRSAVETPTCQQHEDTWDPFGAAGWGAKCAITSSSTAPAAAVAQQQQLQQQQPLVVQAVERTGAASGCVRDCEVPAQVIGALRELHLSGAVGWLRLVQLPPPAAAAAGTTESGT